MIDVYKKLIEVYETGRLAVLCTIVSTKGSTPLKEGAKMIVYDDLSTFGTVGGGKLERETIEKAGEILRTKKHKLLNVELLSTEGTSCGGTAQIYLEMINRTPDLYIFGAGHVGKALAPLAKKMGFTVTVIDDRDDIFSGWEENGYTKVTESFSGYLMQMAFDENTYIVILTYDHDIDWEILSYCAEKPWQYLGMMGSKSKVRSMKKMLLDKGVPEDIIEKINMPIGLEIKAETAYEIALSIAGILVREKNAPAPKNKNVGN